jgi:hypothetical protein
MARCAPTPAKTEGNRRPISRRAGHLAALLATLMPDDQDPDAWIRLRAPSRSSTFTAPAAGALPTFASF